MSGPLKLPDLRTKQNKKNILWYYFIHISTGSIIFIIILLIALGMNKVIHIFQEDVDSFVIQAFIYAERTTVIVDLSFYVTFIILSSIKFAKKLF